MKYRTTRKELVNGSANLVYVGYCDLQNLLCNHEPIAYTCGVYGWNFDVYTVYGVTICTGYRGMPGRRARNSATYEKLAREVSDNYGISCDERREKIETLLQDFCNQV